MVQWTAEQLGVIEKYSNISEVPEEERKVKCTGNGCHLILERDQLLPDGSCPACHSAEHLILMCPVDTTGCNHATVSGYATCPICGEFICPECGSHDVEIASRVTGYVSILSNWCKSKQQEFLDRVRHTITA